jgi:hypothetical protein
VLSRMGFDEDAVAELAGAGVVRQSVKN